MSKIKFVKHSRSMVRKRHDYPSSLFVTIPAKVVKRSQLKQGDIVEFIPIVEGEDVYIKMRTVSIQR